MPKTNVTQYDTTAANNTDVGSISIAEGMAPSDVNNALRELMKHTADWVAGTQAITALTVGSSIKADTIVENSSNTGVTIDGVLLKDTNITIKDAVIFEGATADAYETTLAVTDPTADRTATIPNATGTFMFNVLEDTTPQLGGPIDTNSQAINESEGSAVSSATTTNIWVTDGNTLHISGTTTITSFGTAPRVGAWRKVIFDGALTLTDGSNLNLPGGANITTAADDFAFVYAETTTLFKVLYHKVDGTAVVAAAVPSHSGHVIQVVNTQSGAVATGTTLVVADDTIPQNTEGDQYMTLAVTPGNASNKLIIEVLINLSHASAGGRFIIALFQDSTASALAAVANHSASAQITETIILRHYMTAGTTSATTFKIRAGETGSGTTTFNGSGGSRELGGVMASSITITEISA